MNTNHPDYPIEYISWEVIFFWRKFFVSPDVLIPRLETESLVRRAIRYIQSHTIQTVIDIGTGSGIIGVSLAEKVEDVLFIDISSTALSLAKENFLEYFPEEQGRFLFSDLLSDLPPISPRDTLFLANLPYIKWGDWENMSEDTRFEPELALFWGDTTGFEMYEKLFDQLHDPRFQWSCIMIEFGFDQREIAEKVIASHGWEYEFFADYAGIERFCEVRLLVV
jgi:release factor glutamine methyltransferase